MRYLSLAEALIIGEAVTGIDARTLSRTSRLEMWLRAHIVPARD